MPQLQDLNLSLSGEQIIVNASLSLFGEQIVVNTSLSFIGEQIVVKTSPATLNEVVSGLYSMRLLSPSGVATCHGTGHCVLRTLPGSRSDDGEQGSLAGRLHGTACCVQQELGGVHQAAAQKLT